ncbi:coiled-coil domain-containing protein 186-like isoform X2 [Ostrea edulis]|uniref:coiled-coil domain-containing protein 186-like isoform X2 n=1 Tax=Ostrea edulis TaxID=37623 RepID=UPI0024AF02FB|nr:coiled-coil domain-containing protein 186-like isoform X2 [Ostrea edulis]
MSGLDPDEEATITENPDPESESSAVNETESEENNPVDDIEGEIYEPVANEQIPQGDQSSPDDDRGENVEERNEGDQSSPDNGRGENVEERNEGDQSSPDNDRGENVEGDQSSPDNGRGENVEGDQSSPDNGRCENVEERNESAVNLDEKTEDERETDVGIIREGQISGGRDEQLSPGLGPEEAEADASLIGGLTDFQGENIDSEVTQSESESTQVCVDRTEQRESGTPEVEDRSEGSTSVINSENVCLVSEPISIQCSANNLPGNFSEEYSEVVERRSVIPEDEISCQTWMSEDRPQLSTLSPAESIESCEPECDQETETSPSHGAFNELGESSNVIETGEDEGEHDPEETICVVLNPSCQNEVLSVSKCSSESVTSSQDNVKPTSCSTGRNRLRSGTGTSNMDGSPVNHIQNENKISSSESDDDLLSELESELTSSSRTNQNVRKISNSEVSVTLPNGMYGSLDNKLMQEIQDLQKQLRHSRVKLEERDAEIKRLTIREEEQEIYVERILGERDSYLKEIRQLKSQDDFYLPQIKELEYTIAQQNNDVRTLKDKLASHDAAAKRTVAALQNELKVRVDQVTKMYEEANKEKDSMVVKYAQAEKKFIEGQKAIERLESKVRDLNKEKDGLTQKVKDIKGEKRQLMGDLEAKTAEIQNISKELEKQKEVISSTDVRIKWAQNKLKAELDAHKETKEELSKTRSKLKDAKDETEQIRRDCQAIIKTYQESEEIKSNKLDSELKMKETEFLQQQQEKTSQEERYSATVRDLASLKSKHQELLKERDVLTKKWQNLESQRDLNEQTMTKYREMLQKQKKENKELQDRIEELVQVKSDFKRAQSTIKSLDAEISELKISNKDLQIDMEACRKREAEKLDLTNKLSAKNAELQSENSILHNKTMGQTEEIEKLTVDLQTLEIDFRDISDRLKKGEVAWQEETMKLKEKLEEKSKAVEELSSKVEDGKDEIKTLKRKHVNNIKDLTRQLQQAKKRLENFETNGETQKDSTSMGSRTSSSNSLNTLGVNENSSQPNSYTNKYPGTSEPVHEYPVITEQVEPDSQMLIERIVKLQRGLARRNEKIEFMQEHVQQLVDEIQKKNKIIQNYALREESGTMTLERADINKMELSRKHSIMGSLYSSHQTDSAMTLDLSLEINHKLQAVLEDTILKNITLKESLDTLGMEIARLSQENRQLQLQIQGNPKRR